MVITSKSNEPAVKTSIMWSKGEVVLSIVQESDDVLSQVFLDKDDLVQLVDIFKEFIEQAKGE